MFGFLARCYYKFALLSFYIRSVFVVTHKQTKKYIWLQCSLDIRLQLMQQKIKAHAILVFTLTYKTNPSDGWISICFAKIAEHHRNNTTATIIIIIIIRCPEIGTRQCKSLSIVWTILFINRRGSEIEEDEEEEGKKRCQVDKRCERFRQNTNTSNVSN